MIGAFRGERAFSDQLRHIKQTLRIVVQQPLPGQRCFCPFLREFRRDELLQLLLLLYDERVCLQTGPLVDLVDQRCRDVVLLPVQAQIHVLLHFVLLHEPLNELFPLRLDYMLDFGPVRLFPSFSQEVLVSQFVHLRLLAHANARSDITGVLSLDETVFVPENAPLSHDDKVQHLLLPSWGLARISIRTHQICSPL